VTHDLAEQEKHCAACYQDLRPIGEEGDRRCLPEACVRVHVRFQQFMPPVAAFLIGRRQTPSPATREMSQASKSSVMLKYAYCSLGLVLMQPDVSYHLCNSQTGRSSLLKIRIDRVTRSRLVPR
jgi:hypothetical protein